MQRFMLKKTNDIYDFDQEMSISYQYMLINQNH